MKCKKEQTLKNTTIVKKKCVNTLKSAMIILPKSQQGSLTKFGYSSKNSNIERHNSLKKAIKKYTKAAVIHKLNAVSIMTKKSNPAVSKIYKSDITWVQKQ